jgi:large subunit ribosomal protein L29
MKANELAQLTTEELMERYHKFKEELFHVRFQLATGQLEKTHQLQSLRRNLARVLTFLTQRQAPAPAAPKAAPAPVAKPAAAPKAPKAAKAPKAEQPAKPAKTASSKKKASASAK